MIRVIRRLANLYGLYSIFTENGHGLLTTFDFTGNTGRISTQKRITVLLFEWSTAGHTQDYVGPRKDAVLQARPDGLRFSSLGGDCMTSSPREGPPEIPDPTCMSIRQPFTCQSTHGTTGPPNTMFQFGKPLFSGGNGASLQSACVRMLRFSFSPWALLTTPLDLFSETCRGPQSSKQEKFYVWCAHDTATESNGRVTVNRRQARSQPMDTYFTISWTKPSILRRHAAERRNAIDLLRTSASPHPGRNPSFFVDTLLNDATRNN